MILSAFLWLMIAALLIIAIPGSAKQYRSIAVGAAAGMLALAGYITMEGSKQLASLSNGGFLYM